jgi:hypothetical protein
VTRSRAHVWADDASGVRASALPSVKEGGGISAGLSRVIVAVVTPSDHCAGSHPAGFSSQAGNLRLFYLPGAARPHALRYIFF